MRRKSEIERHPLYGTWVNMKCRCYVKNSNRYQHYGGRGIKVCDRWLVPSGRGFWNFVADLGQKPANPSWWTGKRDYYSLNRINVEGNYTPDNCEWASAHNQAINQRVSSSNPNLFWDNNYRGWCSNIIVSGKRWRKRSRSKMVAVNYLQELKRKYDL